MVNNRLKLNDDKTHLIVMGAGNDQLDEIKMSTTSTIVRSSSHGKLLGCWVNNDLKWTGHIQDSEISLLSSLNTRTFVLRKLQKTASFKARKQLAEGLFMSKLCYLIALWGGCATGLRRSLQVLQNKVARMVTKLDWMTPSKLLLQQCGWLSVNQLAFYHSVLLVYSVRWNRTPRYLFELHDKWIYRYETRQAEAGLIGLTRPRSEIAKSSYGFRAASQFNMLPKDIRDLDNLSVFKTQVKIWIKSNIDI